MASCPITSITTNAPPILGMRVEEYVKYVTEELMKHKPITEAQNEMVLVSCNRDDVEGIIPNLGESNLYRTVYKETLVIINVTTLVDKGRMVIGQSSDFCIDPEYLNFMINNSIEFDLNI